MKIEGPPGWSRLISVRVGDELLERIDVYRRQLEAQLPRLKVSRSEVIRILIEDGLDRQEEEKR